MKRTYLAVASLLLAVAVGCGGSDSGAAATARFCTSAQLAKASQDAQQKVFDIQGSPAPADVAVAVEDFAAKFAAMTAAAPAAIKADVTSIDHAAQLLAAVVRNSNYDVVAMISTPEFAAVSDTLSSADYKAAHQRFQAYIDANCGLGTTTPST